MKVYVLIETDGYAEDEHILWAYKDKNKAEKEAHKLSKKLRREGEWVYVTDLEVK